jgi:type IV pilus assembly protein PilV
MRINRYHPRPQPPGRHQHGASLLEALVALLVLALGVLGLARLQVTTLTETRNSNARAVAVQAASDLMDRMQVNADARLSTPVTPAFEAYESAWGQNTAPAQNCMTATCSSTELAAYDLWQWKASLALMLPSGDATVFRSDSDPSQLGVLLAWSAIQAKNQGSADADNALLYAAADALVDAAGNAGTGVASVTCPGQRICHLVYIRP